MSKLTVFLLPLHMKKLYVANSGDLPRDFLEKFWFEPGDDFVAFLSRLKDGGLSFLLEAPNDATNVSDLISEQVRQIKTRGGPSVPEPRDTGEGQAALHWEFLSCKSIKVKAKDLRQSDCPHASKKKDFIGIAASSKMLAPVDHKVKTIAKEFGFRNPLREHDDEPEKFVIIGARFLGYCSAGITSVYNQDLSDHPAEMSWPHGCYPYRLLHNLKICGENTKKTFSKLLERCCSGRNTPMCHPREELSDDEDFPSMIGSTSQAQGHGSPQSQGETVVSITSSDTEPEQEIPRRPPPLQGTRRRVSSPSSEQESEPPTNRRRVSVTNGIQAVHPPDQSPFATPLSPRVQPPVLAELPADPEDMVTDMINRLGLPMLAAIQVSCRLWPGRLEGSRNVTGYLEWHEKVRPGGSLHRSDGLQSNSDLYARGRSIEDISQALILMMDRFHCVREGLEPDSGLDFQLPRGAECAHFESLGPFFSPIRCYGIESRESSAIVSTGDGPERAILQQVIQTLISDTASWSPTTDSSGWIRPVFTPVLSTERRIRWKTMGTFILLHLLTLGNGPEPVSPFLLYLLLTSALLNENQTPRSHTLLGLKSLYRLDAGAADALRPWMVLKETDQLSGFINGQTPPPLRSIQILLAQCGDFQLSAVGGNRRKEDHEKWTSALITAMFLGCVDPWDRAQFRYLLEGFTVPLGRTGPTVTELLRDNATPSPLDIVFSSYNRQIQAVDDLRQLLVFDSVGGHRDLNRKEAEAIVDGFKLCFSKYLDDAGHVSGMVPHYITEEEYKLHAPDKLFRARTTLRQLTDSWLLPVGGGFKNKIKIVLNLNALSSVTNPDAPTLSISTCSREATVDYNAWLHAVVIDTLKGGSRFGRWLHPQLIHNVDSPEYNIL